MGETFIDTLNLKNLYKMEIVTPLIGLWHFREHTESPFEKNQPVSWNAIGI